ncbi:histidinol phosphatase, partial [Micromonospora sp. DH15]|nr:histidinol phosphatase [Micromonospora sp. DH15]
EPERSQCDVAALVPNVTEAGGTVPARAGRPAPGGDASVENSAVASNGPLHADILARLGRPAER